MPLTLRPTLEILQDTRPLLPQELINEEQFALLQALAAKIPPAVVLGLECRLLDGDAPVDLWICPGLSGADLRRAGSIWPTAMWPDFAPLAGALKEGQIPWPAEGAWTVEFDLGAWKASDFPPQPCSFVTYGSAAPPLDIEKTVKDYWQGARGHDMPSAELEALRQILKRCPSGELAGWGFLYPRAQQPARLMLRTQTLADLSGLLGHHLPRAQRLLEGLTYQVVIGTPLHYEQERRQSLEAYIQGEDKWCELARRLVAQEYCTPAKAQGLLRLALAPQKSGNTLVTLNHVKLALRQDGGAEVKAYPSAFGATNPSQTGTPSRER